MKKKLASAVPGIGPKIAKSLEREGVITAKNLYGRYLINPNPKDFKKIIQRHGGNAKFQEDAYEAIKTWDEQNN